MLVIQIVIKQWDKAQTSEQDIQARQQIPNHYQLTPSATNVIFDKKVALEQIGDDVMGDRIRYELLDEDKFIIDRFGFDLTNKAVVYFPKADSMQSPSHITTLDSGWAQCVYEWRYKVFQGGYYYWLYEHVTLNASFVETLSEDVFTNTAPVFEFKI